MDLYPAPTLYVLSLAACCFDTQLPSVWNINAVGWFGVSSSVTHLAFNHVVAWEKSRQNNFPSWVAVKVFPKSSSIYGWASCLSSVASLIDSCIFGLHLSGWVALSYPATLPSKTRMPAMKISIQYHLIMYPHMSHILAFVQRQIKKIILLSEDCDKTFEVIHYDYTLYLWLWCLPQLTGINEFTGCWCFREAPLCVNIRCWAAYTFKNAANFCKLYSVFPT